MRRPLNWFVVLLSCVFLVAGMTLPGCGGWQCGDTVENPPEANGMLRQVRDAAELESALKRALEEGHRRRRVSGAGRASRRGDGRLQQYVHSRSGSR